MKKIDFSVKEPYRRFLLEGVKKIEGRLNKGKFKMIKQGDVLQMPEGEEFIVKAKKIYKSFKEMIIENGYETIIPDKQNIEDATNVYYKFYKPEDENIFGVAAIFLERIK